MKFCDGLYPFGIKDVEKILRHKSAFKEKTKTRKQIFSTWISTYGISENQHSIGMVDHHFKIDVLFD